MSNQTQTVTSHASSTGRLFIKEEEFFRSAKIKAIVEKTAKVFDLQGYKAQRDNKESRLI